jgi:hypothetical protein
MIFFNPAMRGNTHFEFPPECASTDGNISNVGMLEIIVFRSGLGLVF